jgi:hypothetical protein
MAGLRDSYYSPNYAEATPAPFTADQLGQMGASQTMRGLRSGQLSDTAGSTAYDAISAAAGGDPAKAAELMGQSKEQAALAQQWAPDVQSYKDVHDFSSARDYIAQSMGQAVGSSILPMVGGIAGGLLMPRGLKGLGAFGGAAIPSYTMERNEAALSAAQSPTAMANDPQLIQNTVREKGMINAALEAAVPGTVGRALTGGARNLVKQGVLKTLGKDIAEEAGTEAAQQVSGNLFQKRLDASQQLDEGLVDAALGGAIGGGGMAMPHVAANLAAGAGRAVADKVGGNAAQDGQALPAPDGQPLPSSPRSGLLQAAKDQLTLAQNDPELQAALDKTKQVAKVVTDKGLDATMSFMKGAQDEVKGLLQRRAQAVLDNPDATPEAKTLAQQKLMSANFMADAEQALQQGHDTDAQHALDAWLDHDRGQAAPAAEAPAAPAAQDTASAEAPAAAVAVPAKAAPVTYSEHPNINEHTLTTLQRKGHITESRPDFLKLAIAGGELTITGNKAQLSGPAVDALPADNPLKKPFNINHAVKHVDGFLDLLATGKPKKVRKQNAQQPRVNTAMADALRRAGHVPSEEQLTATHALIRQDLEAALPAHMANYGRKGQAINKIADLFVGDIKKAEMPDAMRALAKLYGSGLEDVSNNVFTRLERDFPEYGAKMRKAFGRMMKDTTAAEDVKHSAVLDNMTNAAKLELLNHVKAGQGTAAPVSQKALVAHLAHTVDQYLAGHGSKASRAQTEAGLKDLFGDKWDETRSLFGVMQGWTHRDRQEWAPFAQTDGEMHALDGEHNTDEQDTEPAGDFEARQFNRQLDKESVYAGSNQPDEFHTDAHNKKAKPLTGLFPSRAAAEERHDKIRSMLPFAHVEAIPALDYVAATGRDAIEVAHANGLEATTRAEAANALKGYYVNRVSRATNDDPLAFSPAELKRLVAGDKRAFDPKTGKYADRLGGGEQGYVWVQTGDQANVATPYVAAKIVNLLRSRANKGLLGEQKEGPGATLDLLYAGITSLAEATQAKVVFTLDADGGRHVILGGEQQGMLNALKKLSPKDPFTLAGRVKAARSLADKKYVDALLRSFDDGYRVAKRDAQAGVTAAKAKLAQLRTQDAPVHEIDSAKIALSQAFNRLKAASQGDITTEEARDFAKAAEHNYEPEQAPSTEVDEVANRKAQFDAEAADLAARTAREAKSAVRKAPPAAAAPTKIDAALQQRAAADKVVKPAERAKELGLTDAEEAPKAVSSARDQAMDEYILKEKYDKITSIETMQRFLTAAKARVAAIKAIPEEQRTETQQEVESWGYDIFVTQQGAESDIASFFTEIDAYHDLSDAAQRELEAWAKALKVSNKEWYTLGNTATKANQQSAEATGAGAPTAADIAAVKTELRKMLGTSIKTEFRDDLHYSGEWTEDDTGNLITIATNAGPGMLSVAYHEAMHEVFHRLSTGGRDADIATLTRVASSPLVMARLQTLLAHEPAALRQLAKDPEERLAYLFQFWNSKDADGNRLIEVGPKATTLFAKLAAYLRRLAGKLRDHEKAEAILQATYDGKLAEPSAIASVLDAINQGDANYRDVLRNLQPLVRTVQNLMQPAYDTLANTDNPHLKQIADLFYNNVGDGQAQQGYLNAKAQVSAQWVNRFATVVRDADKTLLRDVHDALNRGALPASAAGRQLAKQIRAMLTDFHGYLTTQRGLKVGKLDNYYPRVWDMAKIAGQREAFEALLLQHHRAILQGVADKTFAQAKKDYEAAQQKVDFDVAQLAPNRADFTAEKVAQAIVSKLSMERGVPTIGENESQTGFTPFMQAINERKLDFLDMAIFSPYLKTDMVQTLSAYLTQGVKRAEYVSRFGNDGRRINQLMQQGMQVEAQKLQAQGFTKDQIAKEIQARSKLYARAVMAMEGTLGHDVSPELLRFNGMMMVYQNVRLLPLALFSSLIDPMGLLVRGGTLNQAFKAFQLGIKEVVADVKRGLSGDHHVAHGDDEDGRLMRLAESLGTIENAALLDVLGETYSSMYINGKAKRWNDALFRLNGMEGWNRAMRASATQAAIEFIKTHAQQPTAHSERWLTELGLTRDMVQVNADGSLKLFAKDGLSVDQAQQLQAAVQRWVDSAVLRPNAAQRPAWGSDPHYALLFHLKQFTYSFHTTILRRVYQEAKAGNMAPLITLPLAYIPIMIAADVTKGLLTNGGEPPEWQKGWQLGDYMASGYQRAGLFGIGQFALDAKKMGMATLAGPTAQQAVDAVFEPASVQAVKALPMSPLYRDLLFHDTMRQAGQQVASIDKEE